MKSTIRLMVMALVFLAIETLAAKTSIIEPQLFQHKDTVYYYVDKAAKFPGGSDKLNQHIAKQLKYPESARKKKIEGRVIMQFIVERDGEITNPLVLSKQVHKSLQEEAKRIVSTFPKWNSAEHKGKPVRVYINLPITFRL